MAIAVQDCADGSTSGAKQMTRLRDTMEAMRREVVEMEVKMAVARAGLERRRARRRDAGLPPLGPPRMRDGSGGGGGVGSAGGGGETFSREPTPPLGPPPGRDRGRRLDGARHRGHSASHGGDDPAQNDI